MSVLKRPLVTEKVSKLNEQGKYGFIVDLNANKIEVKKEIEKIYKVNVVQINTIKILGKQKTRYTQSGVFVGRKPSYKKAIVTVKKGEVIDFYSNV